MNSKHLRHVAKLNQRNFNNQKLISARYTLSFESKLPVLCQNVKIFIANINRLHELPILLFVFLQPLRNGEIRDVLIILITFSVHEKFYLNRSFSMIFHESFANDSCSYQLSATCGNR